MCSKKVGICTRWLRTLKATCLWCRLLTSKTISILSDIGWIGCIFVNLMLNTTRTKTWRFCKRRWKSFAMFFYSTTEMSGSIFLPTFPVFIVTTNVSLNSCKITQEWRTFIWDFNTPLLIFHTKKRRMRSTTLVLFCFLLTTLRPRWWLTILLVREWSLLFTFTKRCLRSVLNSLGI